MTNASDGHCMTKELLIIALVAAVSLNCRAAEMYFAKIVNNQYQLNINGEVIGGDYDRLITLIKSSPVIYVKSIFLALDSPGGSVDEAIKIANFVENSAMLVRVNEEAICASSCFYIYVSGQMRAGAGSIQIHRPFINNAAIKDMQVNEARKYQNESINKVRSFLMIKSVPSELIDKMMNLSSTESYKLSVPELRSIGFSSIPFEEASIAKCGESPDKYFTNALTEVELNCIKNLMTITRIESLNSILGKKKSREVFREYLLSIGGLEQSDGRILLDK